MPGPRSDEVAPTRLRRAVVLRVDELGCAVRTGDTLEWVRFASILPTPRSERVSPGHLVAVAPSPTDEQVIIWRWYDAVVLGPAAAGSVRAWEPAHGDLIARTRPSRHHVEPGTRAYLSAGLPGADWWIAGPVVARPEDADVDIDEVAAMFTAHGLWTAALRPAPSSSPPT